MMADGPTRGDQILFGRVNAALDLLSRTGVTDVEIAYNGDDDGTPTSPVQWWAKANYGGHRVYSHPWYPYPAQAIEDVLAQVINGGTCARCRKTAVVGAVIDGYCWMILAAANVDDSESYGYIRACEIGDES